MTNPFFNVNIDRDESLIFKMFKQFEAGWRIYAPVKHTHIALDNGFDNAII